MHPRLAARTARTQRGILSVSIRTLLARTTRQIHVSHPDWHFIAGMFCWVHICTHSQNITVSRSTCGGTSSCTNTTFRRKTSGRGPRRISSSHMMTLSNGNIFRVTGPLCGEFTGPGEFPTKRPVTRSFHVYFDLRLNKRLRKQREAGDLRRHRGHYDVNVMGLTFRAVRRLPERRMICIFRWGAEMKRFILTIPSNITVTS